MRIQPTVMVKTEQPKKHTVAKVLVGTAAVAAATIGLAKAGSQGKFSELVSKYKKAAFLTGVAKKLDQAGSFINDKAVAAINYVNKKTHLDEKIKPVTDAVKGVIKKANGENGVITKAKGLFGKAKQTVIGWFTKAKSALTNNKTTEAVQDKVLNA